MKRIDQVTFIVVNGGLNEIISLLNGSDARERPE